MFFQVTILQHNRPAASLNLQLLLHHLSQVSLENHLWSSVKSACFLLPPCHLPVLHRVSHDLNSCKNFHKALQWCFLKAAFIQSVKCTQNVYKLHETPGRILVGCVYYMLNVIIFAFLCLCMHSVYTFLSGLLPISLLSSLKYTWQ